MILTDIQAPKELEQGANNGIIRQGTNIKRSSSSTASSRVVIIDGDQTKPALANINRRIMINEPRIPVIHPPLLVESTFFLPKTRVSQQRRKWTGNK